jgi:MtN3 and saliva related transmembrane protein
MPMEFLYSALCQTINGLYAFIFPPDKPYEWVGFLAVLFNMVCYIPQIRRIRRTQSSKDISFWMFFIWIMGSTTWVIYGIREMRWPVIITNSINLVFRIWVLVYKYIVDRRCKKLSKS